MPVPVQARHVPQGSILLLGPDARRARVLDAGPDASRDGMIRINYRFQDVEYEPATWDSMWVDPEHRLAYANHQDIRVANGQTQHLPVVKPSLLNLFLNLTVWSIFSGWWISMSFRFIEDGPWYFVPITVVLSIFGVALVHWFVRQLVERF